MATIPEPTVSTAKLIDQHHESRSDQPRPHMGASQIGNNCERALWLSFRWAVQPKFKGRILRLFRRGHHEEHWIVQDLRAIGVHIHSTTGQQSRVDFGSHVSGSLDGIIESGLPEAPKKRHVAEFKTHGDKSFKLLQKEGVKKSKPVHYIQMQTYMKGLGIDRAFYLAVNKNTDEIYTERFRLDEDCADHYIERGKRIALADRMPPPLSTSPSWYECKFCDSYDFCHKGENTKHVNCRTCAHATALPDSTWRCELHDGNDIPVKYQRTGCEHHVIHPDLVKWELDHTKTTDTVAAWIIDGNTILNGLPGKGIYASAEVLANPEACLDEGVEQFRSVFNGRITG